MIVRFYTVLYETKIVPAVKFMIEAIFARKAKINNGCAYNIFKVTSFFAFVNIWNSKP